MINVHKTDELAQIPFLKSSTLKGKELLSLGANSFLLNYTPLQKGTKSF